jgi:hypothetical protein
MAAKKVGEDSGTAELLRDMLIVQLGLAGVPQDKIRVIAQCGTDRVTRIVKHLKPKKTTGANSNGSTHADR